MRFAPLGTAEPREVLDNPEYNLTPLLLQHWAASLCTHQPWVSCLDNNFLSMWLRQYPEHFPFRLSPQHSTPWSGVTFYCLCFIFQHFPSAAVFSFCPLMKSLSFCSLYLNSAMTHRLVHTTSHLSALFQTHPKLFPIPRCEHRSHQPCVPARQCISKLFLQALDWHCWKDTFHACQSLWVKMLLTCSQDLHGLPWAAAAKFRCGWSMWHSLSYSYYIFLFIQPCYIFHIFHISALWCKEQPFAKCPLRREPLKSCCDQTFFFLSFLKMLFSFSLFTSSFNILGLSPLKNWVDATCLLSQGRRPTRAPQAPRGEQRSGLISGSACNIPELGCFQDVFPPLQSQPLLLKLFQSSTPLKTLLYQ